MNLQKTDAYRPNYILLTLAVTLVCIVILCGKNFWIPASKIENLYARSIMLSITDTAAAISSWSGQDTIVPTLRDFFVNITGLKNHTSWDNRYYNNRNVTGNNKHDKDEPIPLEHEFALPEYKTSMITELETETKELSALAPTPIMESSQTHSRENPLDVFLFGDSQVFSLGSGLSRLVGKGSPICVDFLAIHSSGFIRSDYYNWPAKLTDTFREKQYEGAIMMLGMNDYQSFRDDEGTIIKKRTPEWEAAYKDKCRNIIDTVLAYTPRLYWLGMPIVKNDEYDRNLVYIESVQNDLAQEYSPEILVRISLRTQDESKPASYSDTVQLPDGRALQIMGGDGTHYTVEGGQYMMKSLFDQMVNDYLFTEIPVANLP